MTIIRCLFFTHWMLHADVIVDTNPAGLSAWHSWASIGNVNSHGPVAFNNGLVTLTPGGC